MVQLPFCFCIFSPYLHWKESRVAAYNFKELEKKWSPVWEASDMYKTGSDPGKNNFYCLDYFPYPSGAGLSVGHCRNYIPTDVICRKKRMDGMLLVSLRKSMLSKQGCILPK
jgi:valyl-tRNA synthetase